MSMKVLALCERGVKLGEKMGASKHDGRRMMFELFPYGYVKQAVKMAGMKQPRAWSTG